MSRKERIISVATVLFAERGYRETSMAELCKETEVAEGTIFYHFKNKEELFLEILRRITDEIISSFREFLASDPSETALDRIEAIVAFYLHLAGSLGTKFLLLHRHFSYELAQVNEVCQRHLEGLHTFILEMFERPLQQGQDDGSIRPLSTKKTAFILFMLVDGVIRLQTYNLYNSEVLYSELRSACRHMLVNHSTLPKDDSHA